MKRFIYRTTDIINGVQIFKLFGHNGDYFVEISKKWDEISGFYEAQKYGYKTRKGAENNKLYKEYKERFSIEVIEVDA